MTHETARVLDELKVWCFRVIFSCIHHNSCPPLLRGQMAELAALDRRAVGAVVGARPHLISRVQTDSDSVSVRHFGRKITFPLHIASALQFALTHDRVAVRDLPGDLDDAGKLTLVRRLIREGLLLSQPS